MSVRIIDSLEIIHDRMLRLGVNEDFHKKNIAVVEGQLTLYRTELEAIRTARKSTPLGELMGVLGGDANKIFEEYRETFGVTSKAVPPSLRASKRQAV